MTILTTDIAVFDGARADEQPLGRTPDMEIRRGDDGVFHAVGDVTDLHRDFLAVISAMAPQEFRTGVTFARSLEPRATTANETHRDKDNDAINFVCFIAEGPSVQHEFFLDLDFWEREPIIFDNGVVIGFTKDLHRRPERAAGTGRKVFLTASVYARDSLTVSEEAEPYECHGGVLGG